MATPTERVGGTAETTAKLNTQEELRQAFEEYRDGTFLKDPERG